MGKAVKGSLKRAGVLALAFILPTAGAAQADGRSPVNAQPGHTYWHADDANMVVDLWSCPQSKICMKEHWLDVSDPKVRSIAKFMLKKDWKHLNFFQKISDDDVRRVCGYETVMHNMIETPADRVGDDFHYFGQAEYHALTDKPGDPFTTNEIDVRRSGDKLTIFVNVHLTIGGTYPDTRTLHLISDPPPACEAPKP